jgi:hypothetical protein
MSRTRIENRRADRDGVSIKLIRYGVSVFHRCTLDRPSSGVRMMRTASSTVSMFMKTAGS